MMDMSIAWNVQICLKVADFLEKNGVDHDLKPQNTKNRQFWTK